MGRMKSRDIPYDLVLHFLKDVVDSWLWHNGLAEWMMTGPPWLQRIHEKLTGRIGLKFIPLPTEVTVVVSQKFVRDSKGWVVVRQYRTVSTTEALEIMDRIRREIDAAVGIPRHLMEAMVEDPPRIPKMIR
jgi:hypothetical protein